MAMAEDYLPTPGVGFFQILRLDHKSYKNNKSDLSNDIIFKQG